MNRQLLVKNSDEFPKKIKNFLKNADDNLKK